MAIGGAMVYHSCTVQQGDSHVAFLVDVMTKMDDTTFCQWAEMRLDGTMDMKLTTTRATTRQGSGTHPQANGKFVTQAGE